ncbi:MAG: tetratricopeptide repeat protein [Thermodesulfobacteriota bacterium]
MRTLSFKGVLCLAVAVFFFTACAHRQEKRKKGAHTHYRLGVVYYKDGRIAEALKELNIAVDMHPKEPSYHVALGLAYLARGFNNEAKKHLGDAIKLKPEFSEARVNLAAVYLKEGDWDGAIAECMKALKNLYYKTPEAAYLNIGWAYHNKGMYSAALENLKKSVELNPRVPLAYYNTGLTLEKMNKAKKAVKAYDDAIKLKPRYMEAYYRKGVALVKVKDRPGALRAFKKVIEIAPGSEKAASARDYIELIK